MHQSATAMAWYKDEGSACYDCVQVAQQTLERSSSLILINSDVAEYTCRFGGYPFYLQSPWCFSHQIQIGQDVRIRVLMAKEKMLRRC